MWVKYVSNIFQNLYCSIILTGYTNSRGRGWKDKASAEPERCIRRI